MITIHSREENVLASGSLSKLSDDELTDVSGGSGKVVSLGNGDYRVSFYCDRCREYSEEIGTFPNALMLRMNGVFKCPECGYTRYFEIAPNGPDSGYYIRSSRDPI